mgnify:CR=1 FL=1
MNVGNWTNLGGAVYEHPSGARIHTYGMLRMPDRSWVNGALWPESAILDRYVRIHGGNRRRGVMAWAMSKLLQREARETP